MAKKRIFDLLANIIKGIKDVKEMILISSLREIEIRFVIAVICNGNSNTQVKCNCGLSSKMVSKIKRKPWHVEGLSKMENGF